MHACSDASRHPLRAAPPERTDELTGIELADGKTPERANESARTPSLAPSPSRGREQPFGDDGFSAPCGGGSGRRGPLCRAQIHLHPLSRDGRRAERASVGRQGPLRAGSAWRARCRAYRTRTGTDRLACVSGGRRAKKRPARHCLCGSLKTIRHVRREDGQARITCPGTSFVRSGRDRRAQKASLKPDATEMPSCEPLSSSSQSA